MAFPLFAPRRGFSSSDRPPGLGDDMPPTAMPLDGQAALSSGASGASASGGRGVFPSNVRYRVLGPGAAIYPRGREVAALLYWTAGLFVALALASYAGDPAVPLDAPATAVHGANWVGPVGAACARGLVGLVGVVAWCVPLEALLLGIPYLRGRKSLVTFARVAGDLLIVVLAAALVQVGGPGKLAFGRHAASGAVGELFGEVARSLFSTIGSYLVGFALLGLILIGRASFSFISLVHVVGGLGARGARGTAESARSVADAWRAARDLERQQAESDRIARLPRISEASEEAMFAVLPDEPSDDASPDAPLDASPEGARRRRRKKREPSDPDARVGVGVGANANTKSDLKADAKSILLLPERAPNVAIHVPTPPPPPTSPKGRKSDAANANANANADALPSVDVEPDADAADLVADVSDAADPEKKPRRRSKASTAPTIVDTSAALEKVAPRPDAKPDAPIGRLFEKIVPAINAGFRLPPMDFLVPAKIEPNLVDESALFRNSELLEKTLSDYGVVGKVVDILPGPTVTTFEVSPAPGTKVSKVASLADDLALALAKKVRIVAPIPGKNRIGFELPNERRIPVNLRDLIEDRRFQTFDVPLPVVLGRDILGNPVYADLASMPHVIVAGATGAGKSVGLNVMLASLLYRKTPDELRLLMIDPKVVELAPFDRIPHMLLPVVTDMKQASNALKWAVDEMDRRYQLFADAGTKNISTFNAWVGRVRRGEARNPAPRTVIAKDHNGLPELIRPDTDAGEQGVAELPEVLPLIVIVVDEFADLMMQQGKEVETAVARLAQKARAAGMHVILATQRPSVDVITGMIKANFPTRIAYRVAQKVDSRTILDEQGAEHLLGKGDMLIKMNGTNETKRVQCPMVSEEEVQLVTDFLRAQGEPVYDENILKPRDDDDAAIEEDAEQDPIYDEAVRLVSETRRCSTSWLQRKLGLGYNRAARVVEMMERRGIVGPANGAKDREVLVSSF